MQKVFIKWIRNAALTLAVTLIGASTGLAQVTVELSQLVGRPGDTGVVTVNISNVEAGDAIRGYGFTVVTDAGVTFIGIDQDGTLAGDAGFQNGTGLPGTSIVGGFAQGTSVETSGSLIKLVFDLDATAAGTVTLTDFLVNADPVANDPPSVDFIVSDRMLSVSDTEVHEDDEFTIAINIDDALVAGDLVISFSMIINYDPNLLTIDKSRGAGGVISSGTLSSASIVGGNDVGGENSGVFLVAGAVIGNGLTGAGVLFEVAAIAGNTPGLAGPGEGLITITNVQFNKGTPIYGAFPGRVNILAFNVASEDDPETPGEFVLDGNYPNPFNPTTTIQFDLPESASVSIQVIDILGRQVMAIPARNLSAGANQTIQISANNLASGLYLYRVIAQSQSRTSVKVGTMTLLK